MTHLTRLGVLLAVLVASLSLTTTAAQALDYDCPDFATQAQAQRYLTAGDPMRLDADGDGIACDSLPCPCSTSRPQPVAATTGTVRERARVIRVVDGDTLYVRLSASGRRRYVRLLGIDTPEVYGTPGCYGAAASRIAKTILPRGTRVRLTSDPSQARIDRYGRLLRYVAKGTTDVDRRLVWLGAARVYVYGGKAFQRVSGYRSAEASARSAHRGLWGAC